MRWSVVLLVACGTAGTNPRPPPPVVATAPPVDAAIAPNVDAAVPIDAAIVVDAQLVLPPRPPPTTGTHHRVRPEKPVKLANGVSIAWVRDGYRRTRTGGAAHTTVAITRGKKRLEQMLTRQWRVELDAFGTTLVLARDDDDADDISIDVMVVGPTQKPMSVDEMTTLIRDRAIEENLPMDGFWCSAGRTLSSNEGSFTCAADKGNARLWQAMFGIYTRRLVFYHPDPRDVCEDLPLAKGCL